MRKLQSSVRELATSNLKRLTHSLPASTVLKLRQGVFLNHLTFFSKAFMAQLKSNTLALLRKHKQD